MPYRALLRCHSAIQEAVDESRVVYCAVRLSSFGPGCGEERRCAWPRMPCNFLNTCDIIVARCCGSGDEDISGRCCCSGPCQPQRWQLSCWLRFLGHPPTSSKPSGRVLEAPAPNRSASPPGLIAWACCC